MCDKYGVMVKEHNADYLGDNATLKNSQFFGIHASNVAPEFGVIYDKGFLYLPNLGFMKNMDLFKPH